MLLLTLLLAFSLRIHLLDAQSLWWDELKTLQRATIPLPEMLADLIRKRGHLPFYFWLMRAWAALGQEPFVLRYFSVISGVLSVALMDVMGRRLQNRFVGLTAAFLLAISPFHIWYSQEARMYTLLPALLLLAHVALLRLLQKSDRRFWLLYGLAMLLALYTHYFAFFVVLAHTVFFVLHWRQLRRQAANWFVTMALVGSSVLVWVIMVATRSGYGQAVPGWIVPIVWYEPLVTIWTYSVGPVPWADNPWGIAATTLFLLGLLVTFNFARQRQSDNAARGKQQRPATQALQARLLLLWIGVPTLIATVISLPWSVLPGATFSIYMDRYLIIVLPAFILLAAWGFGHVTQLDRSNLPRTAFYLVVSFVAIISLYHLYHNPTYARTAWQEATAHIASQQQPDDIVIGEQSLILPLATYGRTLEYVEIPPAPGNQLTSEFTQTLAGQLQSVASRNGRVWLIEPFYNQNAHGFPTARQTQIDSQQATPAQLWLQNNFRQVGQWRYPGLRLTLYDLEGKMS